MISPWNEANHRSQPTFKNPKRAAQYYNIVRKYCRGCKIVAADVIDEPNMERWIKDFRKTADEAAPVGTPQLPRHEQAQGPEAGRHQAPAQGREGRRVADGDRRPRALRAPRRPHALQESESRANSSIKRMFNLAKRYRKRIKRLYIYNWRAPVPTNKNGRFDAGLLNVDGKARPAYKTVQALPGVVDLQSVSDVRRERLARSRLYFVTDLRPGLDSLLAGGARGRGGHGPASGQGGGRRRSSWPRRASSGAAATSTARSSG